MQPHIQFHQNPDCTLCNLSSSGAANPGIATRIHPTPLKGLADTAVLIVGEAPGAREDSAACCWVGPAGTLLQRFLDASLSTAANSVIFLSNACRCRPPQNETPAISNVNACRGHLQADYDWLSRHFSRIIIFCCGKTAVTSVTGASSLNSALSTQGKPLSYHHNLKPKRSLSPSHTDTTVFATYHPAMLLRDPARLHAVEAHFNLVQRFITRQWIPDSLTDDIRPYLNHPVPSKVPDVVSLDIETYGILRKVNQSVFHPVKSRLIDGIDPPHQVVSVALAWKNPEGEIITSYYRWDGHRNSIRRWFRHLAGRTIIGQNLKFDLLYLAYNDSILDRLLTPGAYTLDDTLLASFLYYEQRPEKGLKELAALYGLADYNRMEVTGSSGTARNARDPNLILYNCTDAVVTYRLYEYTWGRIRKKYGDSSAKLTPLCARMRNQILWDVYTLEQSGVAINRQESGALHTQYSQRCNYLMRLAKDDHSLILAGQGSRKSQLEAITNIVRDLSRAGLLQSNRIALTEKTRNIAINADNLNYLLSILPEDSPHRPVVRLILDYHRASKVRDSYTGVLMGVRPKDRRKSILSPRIRRPGQSRLGFLWPSWYPYPAYESKFSGSVGGTIQGRFAAKDPPIQTYPADVKALLCSRFEGGALVGYDLSQIELRGAALLSGDPVMLREYREGVDRHTATASTVFEDADPDHPDFQDTYRQMGKTLNFLVVYKGGPHKFRQTVMQNMGIDMDHNTCCEAIARFDRRYRQFRRWQDSLIDTVRRQGYLELPTGWSRTFGRGSSADTYINEIVNFPIQTIAAQLLQSAHYAIVRDLNVRDLKSRVVLQIHDALYVDVHPDEADEVDQIMDVHLSNPPLMEDLRRVLRRDVPILYEKEQK